MNTQQLDLYVAEHMVPSGRMFGSLDEVQALVDHLRDEPWWIDNYSNVRRVEVLAAPGKDWSQARWWEDDGAGVIGLSNLDELSFCHELAHVLSRARYGDAARGHSPVYARIELETVYHIMGTEAWLALRTAFDNHDVIYDERKA